MEWKKVGRKKPDERVLVQFKTRHSGVKIDTAVYYNKGETNADEVWASEHWRYDCVDGDGFVIEGWYTSSFSANIVFPIDGKVTHWMPLPELAK